jgi:exonuclease VII small subunit
VVKGPNGVDLHFLYKNDKVKNIFDSNDSIKYIKDGDNLLNFKEEKKNAIDNFNDPEKERTIDQKKQILKTITSSIELANTNDVIFSEEIKNKMFEQSNAIAAQETVVQTSLNEFNHYIKKNFEFTSKEEHIIKEINKFFESKHKSKPFSSFYDKFYEVEVKMSNADDTRTYYLDPDQFEKYEKNLKMLNNFLTEFNENSLKLDESKKNYINNLKLLDEMKERLKKPSEYVDKKTHSTRPTKPRFPPMPKLIGK